MILGRKTPIYPTSEQRTLLLKSAGTARFAYNWGLEKIQAVFDRNRGKEKSEWERIPSAFDLSRELNKIKKTEYPWMYEVSKCCPQKALDNLQAAMSMFFASVAKGRKHGFPKPKKRGRSKKSFRLDGSIVVNSKTIQLPRIGVVRLAEADYLPVGKHGSVAVSERAGKWFVSVLTEVPETAPEKDAHPVVGVDLGINTLAVASDGTTFTSPKPLKANFKRLRRLGSRLSRKKKGSNNRRKAKTKLARLHARIANIRKDVTHKLTTRLTITKSRVVIEDLNVKGMMQNRKLSRAISDLGWGEFRRQMEYKGRLYGCDVIVAGQFFPSTQLCHVCGTLNSIPLSVRTYRCDCGMEMDRDLKAAQTLETLAYGTASSAGSRGGFAAPKASGESSAGPDASRDETGLIERGSKRQKICVRVAER